MHCFAFTDYGSILHPEVRGPEWNIQNADTWANSILKESGYGHLTRLLFIQGRETRVLDYENKSGHWE